jgi:hypothetical protein
VLPVSCVDAELGAFVLPPPEAVAGRRAVVATCGAAGLLREGAYGAARIAFTHVLIDEAGQARGPCAAQRRRRAARPPRPDRARGQHLLRLPCAGMPSRRVR